MPISVEVIEPLQPVAPGKPAVALAAAGAQAGNQIYMYNAFYNDVYGSWGYTNRLGFFVLLNPQRANDPAEDPATYFESGPHQAH
jgi:hypothetical protein